MADKQGLFSGVFGKKDKSVPVDDLIDRIDTAIDNLNIKSNNNTPDEDALITKSITDVLVPTGDNGDKSEKGFLEKQMGGAGLDPIFKDLAIPEERLNKYGVYDTIYSNVQIIKKVLSVYLDNIFQKDSISNKTLLIKESDSDKSSGELDEYKKFAERFIEFFNLDERMRNLMFNSLKYGDAYIEYIKLDDLKTNFPKVKEEEAKKVLGQVETPADINSTTVVTEEMELKMVEEFVNQKYSSSKNNGKFILDDLQIDRLTNLVVEFEDESKFIKEESDLIFEFAGAGISKTKKQQKEKKATTKFAGIVLRYHTPHKIVPIVSNYNNILGYIEVRSVEKEGAQVFNPVMGFVDIIKKVSNLKGTTGDNVGKYDKTLKLFATSITKKVLARHRVFYDATKETSYNKKELDEAYQKQISSTLDDELFYSLKRMLMDTGINDMFYKKLNVRFIPVDRMYKFPISNSSAYPFGESIIDPLVYPAKLYLLTQLSNIVTKLSRSSINFSAFV